MVDKAKNMTGSELIKSYLSDIPTLPGIYKMLGHDKKILYVGKAKNLKKRLTNYIKSDLNTKTLRMIFLTHYLEYSVTNSEVEALLLEAQLIKKFQPKFNILLKDDKSFPYIKLTIHANYPQLMKYRGKNLTGGKFFGPFVSTQQVDSTLKELQKIFKLRSCTDSYFNSRKRPCLQYQIGRCSAPCVDKINKEDYYELALQVEKFFNGQTTELQDSLSKKMEELSSQLRFEEAAEIRDRIKALSYIQLKSNLPSNIAKNTDVIAITEKNNYYSIQLFVYRAGQFCGNIAYFPTHTEGDDISEALTQFVNQFYQSGQVPDEILINHPIIDAPLVTKALKQISGNNKVAILQPSRGDKVKLIENAELNSNLALDQHIKQFAKNQAIFEELQNLFELPQLPIRIEVYDNSHIMGEYAVGAMIVASSSGLDKKEYRIFNLQVDEGDDYEMLRKVLTRRFTRLKNEPHKSPSLMIIDGGKGHLSVVQKIMEEFNINIPFVCMSKGPDRNAGLEQFHMPDKEVFTLDKNLPVMKYLQILRDEAHNFAIKNHRLRRSKAIKSSSLDEIDSIGASRKKALLHYFGSYKAICEASIDELAKVQGISKNLATTIYNSLRD